MTPADDHTTARTNDQRPYDVYFDILTWNNNGYKQDTKDTYMFFLHIAYLYSLHVFLHIAYSLQFLIQV